MDQIKVGKFISEKRKEAKLTQSELAEKLNITDRAISKWENGKSMPDSGIISELCKILNITITDLFSGRVVDMKNKEKIIEENILEAIKQKEASDKRLLDLEIILGVTVITFFIIIVFAISYFTDTKMIPEDIGAILVGISTVFIAMFAMILLKIEQVAGYYRCGKCHHRYMPTFKSVLLAPHINRTRYLKCPKCNKKSWNKKVLSRGNEND